VSGSLCTTNIYGVSFTGWPLFWKTWKSQGIEKWSGKIGKIRQKSGKTNYYNYSVATIIVQTVCYLIKLFHCRNIGQDIGDYYPDPRQMQSDIIPLEYTG